MLKHLINYFPAPADGGNNVSLTIKNDDGSDLGTVSEDSHQAADNDTSANLSNNAETIDLKDIFGEKGDSAKQDTGTTRVVADKVTKAADGVQQVKDENVDEDGEGEETKGSKKEVTKTGTGTATPAAKGSTEEQQRTAEQKLYDSRDYSGLPEADVAVLKKLPNTIYNHLAPVLRERATLQSENTRLQTEIKKWTENPNRVPDNWFQSPQAFTLTPEFNQLSVTSMRATTEGQHWEAQLIAIEQGAKEIQNISYNPQTGQYFNSGMLPVTPELKIKLQSAINQARTIESQCQQQAQVLQQTFAQKATEYKNYYGEQDKYFAMLPPDLRPDDKIAKELLDVLHPFDKASPIAQLASKMYSVIKKQGEKIKALSAKKETEIRNQDDVRRAGPANTKSKNGVASSSRRNKEEEDVNLNELMNEMKGES